MYGALDVLDFVVGLAAGIENESVPVLCHFEKLLDRNAAVFAVGMDFAARPMNAGESICRFSGDGSSAVRSELMWVSPAKSAMN